MSLVVSETPPKAETLCDTNPEQTHDELTDLTRYRRIAVLTEGHTNLQYAKTAIALLRFRSEDVVALVDSTETGRSANDLLGFGESTPIVASLSELAGIDALFVGISPMGGRMPQAMVSTIRDAVAAGIDVVAGLHDFLSDNAELVELADRTGARLIDVRKNGFRDVGRGIPRSKTCLRIHTVGHDCSVGKMLTAIELERDLKSRGRDAQFVATGQTGIMVAGTGVPVDCVVSDFLNGAVEQLVQSHEHHDIVLVEGQGTLVHPAYSAVTSGLLHGASPHGMILCYEAGRPHMKGLPEIPLTPLASLVSLYEQFASSRAPARVIGVALNGRRLSPEEATIEKDRVSSELGLPVCDVVRDGPGSLAETILEFEQEFRSNSGAFDAT